MARTGPAPTVEMLDFAPSDDRERFLLVRALVDKGECPVTRAWAILEAIDRLAETGDDGLISPTRSLYRRHLLRLGIPPWKGGVPSEYMGAFISSLDAQCDRRRGRGPARGVTWRAPKALAA